MPSFLDAAIPLSPLDVALGLENVSGPMANLARSIYQQESSGGRNTTTSNAGAVGGMQIIPSTFGSVADEGWDINDPLQNARAGVRYIQKLWKDTGGDPRLTAVGYYGGPGAIAKARQGVAVSDPRNPKAPNTMQYADSVLSRIGQSVADAVIPVAQADELPAWMRDAVPVQAPAKSVPDWMKDAVPVDGPGAGGGHEVTYSAPGADVTLHYDDAPTPVAKKPEPSTSSELGRQLGLTARAAISGVTSIPNMLWNGLAGAINSLAGTSIPLAESSALSDALRLPKPANGTERIAQDVASAMAPVGMFGALGKLGDAATPVARGVTSLLGDHLGAQTATAALGAAGASGAREAGLGPGAQITAGLLSGSLPTVGAYTIPQIIRNAATGGDAGRQNVLENMRVFQAAGTTPTVGQATQRRIPQAIESILSKTPGGAGVMARRAEQQAQEIQARVGGIVSDLSNNAGPVEAGESLARALQGFKTGVKDLQTHLYDTLDGFIPASTPITVNRTQSALADLTSGIDGAQSLSRFFKNQKVGALTQATINDLQKSVEQHVPTGMGGIMSAAPARPMSQATMPYEAIKKFRTLVGQEIDNANFTSDVPKSKWRALYAALSQDLGDAATKAGPEAAQAWSWANAFTRGQMQRLESLKSVIDKDSPEKIFNAAMAGTSQGDTVVRRVVSAIPKENRRDLAAAVIDRMGRATPGNQNDLGEVFSPNTFLTNWNKLSPPAKQTLFGRAGRPGLLGDLGDLATVASNIREGSKVFANPSGTSGALAGLGMLQGAAGAALTGHPLIAAGVLSPMPIANWLSRKMTNPETVRSLGEQRYLPPGFGLGLLAASRGITSGLLSK